MMSMRTEYSYVYQSVNRHRNVRRGYILPMTIGKRIAEARRAAGLTQGQLAKAIGIKQPTLSKLEADGSQSTAYTPQIAAATGYEALWLATGKGKKLSGEVSLALSQGNNFDSAPVRGADVPLISWVQAGSWCDAADPFQPGDAEAWYPCIKKHGPRAFALRVRGPSMFNPGGKPSFEEGDIIFIDPDTEPQPGTRTSESCVIVRLDDRQETTFKQLIEEGDQRWLKALNPQWPEPIIKITSSATICGVCIGKWVD